MKRIGELSADGYGMALLSPELFARFLREKKCRAKKLLSYLDARKELFFEMIKAGRIVPFYCISSLQYAIFVSSEREYETPEGYEERFKFRDFYMEVGELGRVCLAAFDELEYELPSIKAGVTDRMREIPTGADGVLEKYYPRIGFDLPEGVYKFDLIGLVRRQRSARHSKNFGYAFVFTKDDAAVNQNFIKCDNDEDIYKFNLTRY